MWQTKEFMSKNFELMQNLGKERDMFQTATAPPQTEAALAEPIPSTHLPSTLRPIEARPAVDLKPLELKMEEGQRDEIFKLVQRVFFAPGTGGSRLVVVSGTESGNGCSWIFARMAEVLAAPVSATVCAVCAKLCSPVMHKGVGVTTHYRFAYAL